MLYVCQNTGERSMSRYKHYYWEHREKRLQQSEEWYKKHKEEFLKKQHQKRRNIKYGAILNDYQKLVEASKIPKLLTEKEKMVYAASAIDCEGTITVDKPISEIATQGFYLHPVLSLENTDETLVKLCQQVLQIKTKLFHMYRPDKKHKDSWRFKITGKEDVLKALIKIRPFLVVKRKQADLLMEFILNRLFTKRPYTTQELEIVRKIRQLNIKGKPI